MEILRHCTVCGQDKPESEYYVQVKATGRRFTYCKACHYEKTLEWQAKNREKVAAIARANYAADPEKFRARSRAYHASEAGQTFVKAREQLPETRAARRAYKAANREKIKAAAKAYREANRDKIRASNEAYREANRAIVNERLRRWIEANPERYREIQLEGKHRRRTRIAGNGGSFTAAEWEGIKEAHDYRCVKCHRREPDIALTVDHIVPVSKGGTSYPFNLQPLCKPCNSRKHAKLEA